MDMQNFMITLLVCSVVMSALALLYMAATPQLAKHYSEKGRYYAWLIIVVGLIVPFRPQWGNALVNVTVPANELPPVVMNGGAPINIILPVENAVAFGEATTAVTATWAWWQIVAAIWVTGVIVFIAYHGIKHFRFMKMTQRWSTEVTDEQILSLLESLKSEMGISKRIPIFLCQFAGSPMMIGLIKPRILLPGTELAQDELRFVLQHELVHYKRKDLLYKYLVLTATALHWFNPAVYLIAKAVNELCEMSCDAEVLRNTDMDTRQSYGETIIGVLQYHAKLKTALSTNFYGGKKSMKTRISSIMDTRKKKAGVIIATLVFTLAMVTGCVLVANPAKEYDSTGPGDASAILVIAEETFIEQTDYIRFFNPEEHLGKKIKLEGLYRESRLRFYSSETGDLHHDAGELQFVGRRLDHEYDFEGWVGFLVLWDGERPENYSWVEAVGIFEYKEVTPERHGGYILNLTSLTVLDERGLEILPDVSDRGLETLPDINVRGLEDTNTFAETTIYDFEIPDEALGAGFLRHPLPSGRLTAGFGEHFGRMHFGVDWAAPRGTAVRAADGGIVTFADYKDSFGNLIIINHGAGMETYYAHLDEMQVSSGDTVYQGQHVGDVGSTGRAVGDVGSTGRAVGSHLHFEVHIDGEPQDPLNFMFRYIDPESLVTP